MSPMPAVFDSWNSRPEPRPGSGGRLVSADAAALPLRAVSLRADACGGSARVVLEQRFENRCAEPLQLTYRMPLPADAAVSGYAFRIGERCIRGEVDRRDRARERFEDAIASGHTAGILEQERTSLFTQELGNVPPGVEVIAVLTLDQPLLYVGGADRSGAGGAWEWRFPLAAAPRYLGEAGRVADAAAVELDVAEAKLPIAFDLVFGVRDALPDGAHPRSPSHRIESAASAPSGCEIRLAESERAALDRDVVLRWRVASELASLSLDRARPAAEHPASDRAFGLLTLLPPAPEAASEPLPRDLIALIDTSGSMQGAPLAQAKRVVSELVESLGEGDRFELIEFSSQPRRWKRGPERATFANKLVAKRWIHGLEASGGTEMRDGLLEALAPLRADAQRQVVLVTDGLVGFETEMVSALLWRLPSGSRVHCVGIGSAMNRSLTSALARAGRGVEVLIDCDESSGDATRRLLAHTAAPALVDLQLEGDALLRPPPARVPDVYAGCPLRLPLALRAEGGTLRVRAKSARGEWSAELAVPATALGEGNRALPALFARERVEGLELELAAGGDAQEREREIEQLGIDYQISTRLTSWVAIDEIASVDPTQPSRRIRVPQQLPHQMSVEGLGLRAAAPGEPMALTSVQIFDADVLAPRAKRFGAHIELPEAPPAKRRLVSLTRALTGAARASAEIRLRGRLIALGDGGYALEIELDRALDFEHPLRVVRIEKDGSERELRFAAEASTREGRCEPGQVLRLRLRELGPASHSVPVALRLECAGKTLVVSL
jgi:Ca-activated chloride channel family protein